MLNTNNIATCELFNWIQTINYSDDGDNDDDDDDI